MNPPPVDYREPAAREVHLRDYWKVVWQGRWTVLASFLIVVGLTAIWTFLQTPVYQATAVVEVQPQGRQLAAGTDVSGLGAAGYGWFAEEKYHNTQVEIIRSRDVARRVVDRLDLGSHPQFEEADDPVDVFRRRIRVDPRRDTGLIEISISGTDADEITQWVNSIADVYVRRNLERAKSNMQESIHAIQDQLIAFKANLAAAEEERVLTLEKQNLFNTENQEEILRQKLRTYNDELTEVLIERSKVTQTLQQIDNLGRSGGDPLTLPELAQDETLRQLERDKVDLERQLESAKVDLRPGHPDYEKVLSELGQVEQRLRDRVNLILGALQNRLVAAKQQEQYLRQQIRDAEEFSLQIAKATSTYDIVKTDAEAQKTVLDMISRALNDVQLGAQLMTNNVSLLDYATPPRFPVKPRRRMNLMLGAMFGLCVGVAFVFFLDYLDNTFRTPEDIEKQLGLAVLGVIPKLGDEGLSHRAVKEAYQSLRTSVIFSSKSRQRKLLLITSTGPQEGKSSTVANLGRTLAQSGDRVIVIDCDLRRPTQHFHMKSDREQGLTNYLAAPGSDVDWRPFVKTVGPATLHLMTCGPIPPSPPELLDSDRFRDLLSDLREEYDWVLVDSPPSSSLADATLLASAAEMVLLVVQHNRTDRDLVSKTVQRLRAVNATLCGAVLNNVDIDRAYNKDYYYAGYYYYGQDDKKERRRKRIESRSKVG